MLGYATLCPARFWESTDLQFKKPVNKTKIISWKFICLETSLIE